MREEGGHVEICCSEGYAGGGGLLVGWEGLLRVGLRLMEEILLR